MRPSRVLQVFALCVSIGVPATLAVSKDCRTAVFDSAWAQRVRAMKAWDNDPKNRVYVEKHKLKTSDLSRATAALRARMRKRFDLACGPDSILQPEDLGALGQLVVEQLPTEVHDGLVAFSEEDQDVIPSDLRGIIPQSDLPQYDSPERVFDGGAQGSGGWFGGWGGYGVSTPPSGPGVPVLPVPTPEPSELLLMSTGMFGLAFWSWRRR